MTPFVHNNCFSKKIFLGSMGVLSACGATVGAAVAVGSLVVSYKNLTTILYKPSVSGFLKEAFRRFTNDELDSDTSLKMRKVDALEMLPQATGLFGVGLSTAISCYLVAKKCFRELYKT